MFISSFLKILLFLLTGVFSVKDEITINRENELKSLLNRTVDPCDDFFEFACGNYKTFNPIPEYRSKFEVLDRMTDENYKILDKLLTRDIDEVLQKSSLTAEEKAKVFYSSCKNTVEIDRQGNAPLLKLLDSLGGLPLLKENWTDPYDHWVDLVAEVHKIMYKNPMFDEFIKDRDKLNLVDRIMPTFQPSSDILAFSEAEQNKLLAILNNLGLSNDTIYKTIEEYKVIYVSLKVMEELPTHTVKTANISEFQQKFPYFHWTSFLTTVYGIQFNTSDYISVWDTEYFEYTPYFLDRENSSVIANFVLLNLINELIPVLDSTFMNISDTYYKEQYDQQSPTPRWMKCINIVTEVMNIPTALMFIRETYNNDSTTNIQQMLNELKSIFKNFLQNSSWPGEHTKAKALEKLDAIDIDLSWKDYFLSTSESSEIEADYESVTVTNSNFFESYIKMKRIAVQKIGKVYLTQSRNERWQIPLIEAEAYNNPERNKLTMNPGVLRSPFYHYGFTNFLKYGGLAFTLAHEIFHSFDTLGARMSAEGKYENWWDPIDYDEFLNRTKCFKNQYDNYTLNGVSLQKRESNAENIADASGIKFAYMAYDKFLTQNPNFVDEILPGLNLTTRQLFFVSTAQCFCTTLRDESTEFFITTDSHAQGPFRVNGFIENSEDFAEQFQCPVGSRMNPAQKCSIYS